jgi:hypothetical protein
MLLQKVALGAKKNFCGKTYGLAVCYEIHDFIATAALTYQLTDLVLHGEVLYSSREAVELETLWQRTLSITNVLRDILETGRPFSPTQAKRYDAKLGNIAYSDATLTIRHAERHLELRRCAVRIVWAKLTQQTEEQGLASDGMTATLNTFIDGDEESPIWAAPFIIPLLVPAIATYLTALSNKDEDASAQLSVYVYFLTAIEDNYPAASMLKGVLIAAKEAIRGRDTGEKHREEAGVGVSDQFEDFGSFAQEDLFDLSWIGN